MSDILAMNPEALAWAWLSRQIAGLTVTEQASLHIDLQIASEAVLEGKATEAAMAIISALKGLGLA